MGYPYLTVPGQAFLRQFTNAIVHILTGNIIKRYLKSNSHAPNLLASIIYSRVNIVRVYYFAHANPNTHGT